jgi:hypothetical protein
MLPTLPWVAMQSGGQLNMGAICSHLACWCGCGANSTAMDVNAHAALQAVHHRACPQADTWLHGKTSATR